jgi:protein-S-isoprenylcysteine O-methyltransferase Ste14
MVARITRLFANAIITVCCVILIITNMMFFSFSNLHWLWGVPAIFVSLLDLFFLTKSTLKAPQKMDTRLSTFLISVSGALTFSIAALIVDFPPLPLPYLATIQQVGRIAALVPYPFIIAALLSLGNCLTVIPEAHSVVAHGIYKYSRHPLYMSYLVWNFAYIFMFPSWQMILLNMVGITVQILRIRREEFLLLATFPEYQGYYLKTGILGSYRGTLFLGKPYQ